MPDEPSATSGAEGQDAPLSQADIDAALGSADDAADPPSASESSGQLSQEDIDAALNQGDATEPAPTAPAPTESGSVSQDDIDALLAGGDPAPAAAAPEAGGALTQADIDAALASGPADEVSPEPEQRLDSAGRPFDEAAAAMAAAIAEEQAAAADQPAAEPVAMPDFGLEERNDPPANDIDLLHDVNLQVKIELGRTRMFVEDVLRLGDGSVLELDKLAGDPVDVFANDRLIARGEVLVLNDNFCVRVSEIISQHAVEG